MKKKPSKAAKKRHDTRSKARRKATQAVTRPKLATERWPAGSPFPIPDRPA